MTKKEVDELTYRIIGAAINVHKVLGPGLLESVYQICMKEEFAFLGIPFSSQLKVEVTYREKDLDTDFRCDFLVNDTVVVELKAIEALAPIHDAQLMTYMKLMNKPKGVLINFCSTNIFRGGQKTIVNEICRALPDE